MKITKKLLSVLLGLLVIFSTISCCLPMASAITSAERAQNIQTIYKFLTSNGYNAAVACGILANIEQESNFNPNDVGDNGSSYGICQWHDGNDSNRFTLLKTYCKNNGLDYKNINAQLKFLKYELESDFSSFNKRMKAYPNTSQGAYDSAYDWCVNFEKPDDKVNKGKSRGARARDYYWPTYADSATPKAPTINLTKPTQNPITISVGSSLGIWGTVSANGAATTVKGEIKNSNMSATVSIGANDTLNLRSSPINEDLKFDTLKQGTYTLVITATNSVGTVKKEITVNVGNVNTGNLKVQIDDLSISYLSKLKDNYPGSTKIAPKVSGGSGNYSYTWTSSNPKVATVDANGNIKAIKRGAAEIKCTVKDNATGGTTSDTCEVNVTLKWYEWILWIFLFGWAWY